MNKYLYILLIALIYSTSFGQKKTDKFDSVLKIPKRFESPVGYNNGKDISDFISSEHPDEDIKGKAAWLVISDRNNNIVYKKANVNSQKHKFSLKFKETFYVVDTKGNWLHIVKTNKKPSNLSLKNRVVWDYGWIKREKMLLWRNSLIDPVSGINQKAFLLNKVDNIKDIIESKNKNLAKIYDGPSTKTKASSTKIHEFYFVIKRQSNKYLLSKEVKLSSYSMKESLIGWVRESRIEDWNTRLAMEPNFDSLAYLERKNNPNFNLFGYATEEAARAHNTQGYPVKDKIIWSKDPVNLSLGKLDNKTHRRFKGAVIRFPLFEGISKKYFRSGVIGDITAMSVKNKLERIDVLDYSSITKKVELYSQSIKMFDVFFLIEASTNLNKYKQSIIKSIERLLNKYGQKVSIRFGIGLYTDYPEKKNNRMFNILPFTKNKEKVIAYLNDNSFGSVFDNDPFTILYHGLNQSILNAGFNPDHTNILFAIGEGADFKATRSRRVEAVREDYETLIDYDEITDKLAEFNINLIAIQPIDNGKFVDKKFRKQMSNFILEAAKTQHAIYSHIGDYIPNLNLKNPTFPDYRTRKSITLKGGSSYGRLIWPSKNAELKPTELVNHIVFSFNDVKDYVFNFSNTLKSVFLEGDNYDVSAGELNPLIAHFIEKSLNKELDKETIKLLLKDKYKLYQTVYLPRHIKDAKYKTTSFVLFMPEDDLSRYISQLEELAYAAEYPVIDQRQILHKTLIEWLKQYTGESSSKKDDKKKRRLNYLRNKMNGLSKEGFSEWKEKIDFNIDDMLTEDLVSDEVIIDFVDQVSKKLSKLKQIKSLKQKYEFSYSSNDNIYFWIDINDTF